MEKKDLQVGQTVWIYQNGRNREAGTLDEGIITKLGNKYFYAKGKERGEYDERKFLYGKGIEETQYNYKRKIYLSKEAWEAERKTSKQLSAINEYFRYGGGKLTPEQIEAIYNIITPTS